MYANGQVVPWGATPSGAWEVRPTTPTKTVFGNSAGSLFDGALDEIAISSVLRSADWIRTEYNNQKPNSTFLSVGVEQAN